tara:strand:- start:613 stop:903 length:291 start_codon:yes stop_codon:yes gene_type:complete
VLLKKSREPKILPNLVPSTFCHHQTHPWNIRGVPQMFHMELFKKLGGILMLKGRYQKENYLSILKITKSCPSVTKKNETKLNIGVGVELIATLGQS